MELIILFLKATFSGRVHSKTDIWVSTRWFGDGKRLLKQDLQVIVRTAGCRSLGRGWCVPLNNSGHPEAVKESKTHVFSISVPQLHFSWTSHWSYPPYFLFVFLIPSSHSREGVNISESVETHQGNDHRSLPWILHTKKAILWLSYWNEIIFNYCMQYIWVDRHTRFLAYVGWQPGTQTLETVPSFNNGKIDLTPSPCKQCTSAANCSFCVCPIKALEGN